MGYYISAFPIILKVETTCYEKVRDVNERSSLLPFNESGQDGISWIGAGLVMRPNKILGEYQSVEGGEREYEFLFDGRSGGLKMVVLNFNQISSILY